MAGGGRRGGSLVGFYIPDPHLHPPSASRFPPPVARFWRHRKKGAQEGASGGSAPEFEAVRALQHAILDSPPSFRVAQLPPHQLVRDPRRLVDLAKRFDNTARVNAD